MKKQTLSILTFLIFQISAISQPCLPEGITFTTQSQIDSFQIMYPNCTEIEGDLEISGNDITNLDGLLGITEINGNLAILDNDVLNDLFGLNYLNHVGGHFYIGINSETGNPFLSNLTGLNNLSSIGGSLKIIANHQLYSLNGLNGLTSIGEDLAIGEGSVVWGFTGNNLLSNLDGLENLEIVGGNFQLYANNSLNNLNSLSNLTTIGGGILLNYNDNLVNLSGLESLSELGEGLYLYKNKSIKNLIGLEGITNLGKGVIIRECDSLVNLEGLNNIEFINGEIRIVHNPFLLSLSGLENVTNISGGLMIWVNNNLIDLSALSNLTSIGLTTIPAYYGIIITGNPILQSLSGIENIEPSTIELLQITGNDSLTTCEARSICDYLASPNADVSIYSNAPGCNSIEEVQAACDTVSIQEVSLNDSFIISPNPCTNYVNLEFTLFKEGYVIIDLLDISGIKLEELINEPKKPKKYTIKFDMSNLPTGIYIIRYQNRNGIYLSKIVKR